MIFEMNNSGIEMSKTVVATRISVLEESQMNLSKSACNCLVNLCC